MLELLLRVALTPQGTAKLLASCEVLRHSEADERRLAVAGTALLARAESIVARK